MTTINTPSSSDALGNPSALVGRGARRRHPCRMDATASDKRARTDGRKAGFPDGQNSASLRQMAPMAPVARLARLIAVKNVEQPQPQPHTAPTTASCARGSGVRHRVKADWPTGRPRSASDDKSRQPCEPRVGPRVDDINGRPYRLRRPRSLIYVIRLIAAPEAVAKGDDDG